MTNVLPQVQALQIFYGSIPVILVIPAAMLLMHRDAKTKQILLRNILERIIRTETLLFDHDKRITALQAGRWK